MMYLLLVALAACSDVSAVQTTAASAAPAGSAKVAPTGVAPAVEAAAAPLATSVAADGQTAPAAKYSPAAASGCTFTSLERFEGRIVKWEGACEAGKAQGKGALRAYPAANSADKAVLLFFGFVEHGEPKLGVIDTPDGFIAGPFSGGKAMDSEDPNVTLHAFREASQAAAFVSERMKAAGNAASANFYARKAKTLQEQMD